MAFWVVSRCRAKLFLLGLSKFIPMVSEGGDVLRMHMLFIAVTSQEVSGKGSDRFAKMSNLYMGRLSLTFKARDSSN